MRKKFLHIILISVMAGTMLVGCANENTSSDQPSENVSATTTENSSQLTEGESTSSESTESVSEETSSNVTESVSTESEVVEDNNSEETKEEFTESATTETEEVTEEIVASGFLEDADIEWKIVGTTLYVSGDGEIPNFEFCAQQSRKFPDTFLWNDLKAWQPYDEFVEKIVIEEGVTKIGNFNFAYFKNTKEIVFADSVTEIGKYACTGLGIEKLNFNNITKVGTQAFGELNNLKSLTVPGTIKTISFACFYNCKSPYLTDIYIEEGVETIKEAAFEGFLDGCSLHLPSSITSLNIGAFSENMTVYVQSNSYSELFLKEDGHFVAGLTVIVE